MHLISVQAHCRNNSATVPSLSIPIVRFCRIPQTGSEDACATVSVSNEMSAFRSPTACGNIPIMFQQFSTSSAAGTQPFHALSGGGDWSECLLSQSEFLKFIEYTTFGKVPSLPMHVQLHGVVRRSCHQGIPSARRSPAMAIHKVEFSDASMPLFSLSHFSHNLAHSTRAIRKVDLIHNSSSNKKRNIRHH